MLKVEIYVFCRLLYIDSYISEFIQNLFIIISTFVIFKILYLQRAYFLYRVFQETSESYKKLNLKQKH